MRNRDPYQCYIYRPDPTGTSVQTSWKKQQQQIREEKYLLCVNSLSRWICVSMVCLYAAFHPIWVYFVCINSLYVGWIDGITINGYKTYHDKRVNPSQSLCDLFFASVSSYNHLHCAWCAPVQKKIICGGKQLCPVFLFKFIKVSTAQPARMSIVHDKNVRCIVVNSFMVLATITRNGIYRMWLFWFLFGNQKKKRAKQPTSANERENSTRRKPNIPNK